MTIIPGLPQPSSPIQDMLSVVGPLRELIDLVWWTDAVPRSYKWSRREGDFPPEKVKALMLASALLGNAMGVDPFRSWANIHPTGQGRFAIAADFKVGLTLAAGCEIETIKREPEECHIRGRRRGGEWQELKLTMADARRAGWQSNPLYDKVPGDMLYHRASGRMADMLAAHVTLGIVTYEDYADIDREQDVRGLPDRLTRQIEAAEQRPEERVERPRRSPVAELIGSRDERHGGRFVAEEDIPPAVRRALRPEDAENAPAPPVTPTERVRRSAEKLGIGDDPEAGEPEAWMDADYPLPKATGTTEVEIVEATPEQWAEIVAEAEARGDVEGAEMLRAAGTPVEEPDDPATWQKNAEPPAMITNQQWNDINALFRDKHDLNGTGSVAARYRVIEHVIHRQIHNGRELTAEEANRLHQFLTDSTPTWIQQIAKEEK